MDLSNFVWFFRKVFLSRFFLDLMQYWWSHCIIPTLISSCVICVVLHIYEFFYYNQEKRILDYKRTLTDAKEIIVKDYPEYCWEDEEFCKAYLDLVNRFKFTRNVALNGWKGQFNDRNGVFLEFEKVEAQMKDYNEKIFIET